MHVPLLLTIMMEDCQTVLNLLLGCNAELFLAGPAVSPPYLTDFPGNQCCKQWICDITAECNKREKMSREEEAHQIIRCYF